MATSSNDNQETRILRAVKLVLTRVIKDTSTPPGHQHPLSDGTIEDMRQCLALISARERDLADAAGQKPGGGRPYFTDDPKAPKVIPLSSIGKNSKKPG